MSVPSRAPIAQKSGKTDQTFSPMGASETREKADQSLPRHERTLFIGRYFDTSRACK